MRRFTPWNVLMPACNSSGVSSFFSSSIALTPTMFSMLWLPSIVVDRRTIFSLPRIRSKLVSAPRAMLSACQCASSSSA